MKRIRIGISGPDQGGLIAWLMTAWAVWRCGGRPLRVTPSRPADEALLQGLIIGGGTDVEPLHYGESRPDESADTDEPSSVLDWLVGLLLSLVRLLFATGSSQDYDPDRDRLEQHLIQHALYHDIPILGICRGAQLMNVVLGGSLHQNIEHFYSEETNNVRSVLPRKRVALSPGSRLHKVLATDHCAVNALHDQSIKDLGDGVNISATEHTGVIQAVERPAHSFFIGVQWHPEYMPQSRIQQRLFRELLACAARKLD